MSLMSRDLVKEEKSDEIQVRRGEREGKKELWEEKREKSKERTEKKTKTQITMYQQQFYSVSFDAKKSQFSLSGITYRCNWVNKIMESRREGEEEEEEGVRWSKRWAERRRCSNFLPLWFSSFPFSNFLSKFLSLSPSLILSFFFPPFFFFLVCFFLLL